MIPSLAVALVLGGLAAKVQPETLRLGKDSQAQIEILATGAHGEPLANAALTGTATAGQLSGPRALGNGHFRFTYSPPRDRFPQVALVRIQGKVGGTLERTWVAIPLSANAVLRFETKPFASVTAQLGSQQLGPVTANKRGQASITAVVPPGISTATMTAVDRAENTTSKVLNLEPRPFPLFDVWSSASSASWSDPAPVTFELFAILPDGRPAPAGQAPRVQPEQGTVEGPTQVETGLFAYTYRPPEHIGASFDAVSISMAGSPARKIPLEMRPGPPTQVGISFAPDVYRAGSDQPVRVRTTAQDAKGNPIRDLKATVDASLGTLTKGPAGMLLEVPDQFRGNTRLHLRARAAGLSGEGDLTLQPGPPVRAELSSSTRYAHPGQVVELPLKVFDGYGNPVPQAPVSVADDHGRILAVLDLGGGRYLARYLPARGTPAGPMAFRAYVNDAPISPAVPVVVVHGLRPWQPSAGLFLHGQSNFSRARGLGLRAQAAVNLGETRFELLFEATLNGYHQIYDPNGVPFPIYADVATFPYGFGLRANFPLKDDLDAYTVVVGGVASVGETVWGQISATESTPKVSVQSTSRPWGEVAGGVSYPFGPGRLMGQLEYIQLDAIGPLSGNLGGFGINAGYLLSF